jgi:hypothetical protein
MGMNESIMYKLVIVAASHLASWELRRKQRLEDAQRAKQTEDMIGTFERSDVNCPIWPDVHCVCWRL